MNVLFLTCGLPWPPDRGARIRDFNLIKQVSRYHRVSLLSLLDPTGQPADASGLEPFCARVETVEPERRSIWGHLNSGWRHLRAGRPLAVHDFYFEGVARKLRRSVDSGDVDLVQFEHSFFAPYIDALPGHHGCITVLDFHNIGFQQYRRMPGLALKPGEKLVFWLKSMLMRGWEARYARRFDACLATSAPDAGLLRVEAPGLPVSVIPNGVDTDHYPFLADADGAALLLVGTIGYPPNRDAALFFCREILPLVERRTPEVVLNIVGHAPPPEIRAWASRPNIEVTGPVPDVRPYYQEAALTVVPLRAGGGTRLKILESMALGRAVVSTTVGCEGLDVVDGEHLLIADSAPGFAAAVTRLLRDRPLRREIARNARNLVKRRYDWGMIGENLAELYDRIRGYPPA